MRRARGDGRAPSVEADVDPVVRGPLRGTGGGILAAIAVVLLLLPGCVAFSSEYEGNPIDPSQVGLIEPGRTTRAEVLELLGAPLAIDRVDITGLTERLLARFEGDPPLLQLDPALFDELYIYQRSRTERFGLILILYNRFSSDRRSDRLTVLFDPEGVVIGVGWTPGAEEM